MSTIDTSSPFLSYILTPQEVITGSQLSLLQRQCIQNIIASYATERIAREIPIDNPLAAVQADAKNKGQIEALQHLLDLSNAADQAARDAANPHVPSLNN